MLICDSCHKQNPTDVQFCLSCGWDLAQATRSMPTPPPVAEKTLTPQRMALAPGSSRTPPPVYRPFGVVFSIVSGFCSGVICVLFSTLFTFAAPFVEFYGRMGSYYSGYNMTLVVVGCSLFTIGLFDITASVGLWMMAEWGRKTACALKIVGISGGGLLMLLWVSVGFTTGNGSLHANSIGLILGGMALVGYCTSVLVYLNRYDIRGQFRDNA